MFEMERFVRLAAPRKVYIETGLKYGDTILAMEKFPGFDLAIGIELVHEHAEQLKKLEERFVGLRIVEGDSGEVIGQELELADAPCAIYLDAHDPQLETDERSFSLREQMPINRELVRIGESKYHYDHLVKIDDAHFFYPDARLFHGEVVLCDPIATHAIKLNMEPLWKTHTALLRGHPVKPYILLVPKD